MSEIKSSESMIDGVSIGVVLAIGFVWLLMWFSDQKPSSFREALKPVFESVGDTGHVTVTSLKRYLQSMHR